MRISIVGTGYVGLVAAVCFAELGHEVTSVDNDIDKIASLRSGLIPIHEEFLPELVARHHGGKLSFTDDLARAVASTEVIFITVGTPPMENGEADLFHIESVACEIARAVNGQKVIVEKSTVPIYTNEWIRRTLIREGASPESFDVVSNPEFLREGTAVQDFLYPDRIVIGSDNNRSSAIISDLYSPLIDGSYALRQDAVPAPDRVSIPVRVIVTSAKSAELIKHASNAFLAMKISYINAVSVICEATGADVQQVCLGVGSDSRIGDKFLRPGIGYGGSCFPKDLLAFRTVGREVGYDFHLLDQVIRINEEQRHRFLQKVRKTLWTLKGKRLGVLGLAFKGGTDDIRDSPAISIVQSLLREGCVISAYDPSACDHARKVLSGRITFAPSAYDAADRADALLILTDWQEFASLDLDRVRTQLKYPVVIDGRNLYSPQAMAVKGFTYCSIGRAECCPATLSAVAASQ